ncbi:MAG TPA: PEP-CTERM sorting domain-containing protein, partial [Gammaproteobacteria bacterium]|nr:PEP-CTERM sorting domain-containing protein [Gammaproteobacteria bacterium]
TGSSIAARSELINGGQHHADLALTDAGKTWILTDDHIDGGFTVISNGTYTVEQVPEPVTLFLFASGVAVLGWWRRRRS